MIIMSVCYDAPQNLGPRISKDPPATRSDAYH